MPRKIDRLLNNQALMLHYLQSVSPRPDGYEGSRIFSQWNEDLILLGIVDELDLESSQRTFIEFGVEDFFESNCRFLLEGRNWRGFVLDGSRANIQRLVRSDLYWKHDLNAETAFVTSENIQKILERSGFGLQPGVLSIDLDGIDFWVLEKLEDYRPVIYIVEFNAVLGLDRTISVPYKADFQRTAAHHSNLYWGASLPAYVRLLKERGYSLVRINDAFSNAFFVRADFLPKSLPEIGLDDLAGRTSQYRESRDSKGKLSFLAGQKRHEALRGLPVINTETGEPEKL
jgi:hypothetical protein